MKIRSAIFALLAIPVLLTGHRLSAQERGWELSFDVLSTKTVLMEPVWARLHLENVSDQPLPEVKIWGRFYLDSRQRPCRSDMAPPNESVPPGRDGNADATPVPFEPRYPGWGRSIVVNLGDVCNLIRRGEAAVGHHTVCYRDDASVGLITRSACASFDIVMPVGVDKEAYEAFDHNPLGNSERWGELLRRFPTSTYAAYVVWKNYLRFVLDTWSIESLTQLATEPPWSDSNSVPCELPTGCGGRHWRSLEGEAFRSWRARWGERILKHHPNIWFADQVRFRLALDRYLLGDKPACAAGLEALAEHGRPEVGAKAKDLLAAMRAKGMLPEEGRAD